ncbi:glutaminase A, partial [Cryphonectria parasitica EP155]
PPAIPLAVRGPYTSAWSSTAGDSTLNSADPIFWPGDSLGWEGIVMVDGIAYEYLGTGSQSLPKLKKFQIAKPGSVSYDSQYSNFTFHAGPVEILASFFSPVTPKDICRSSIPLSYLTTSISSQDGQSHDVQFYSDINGAWISYESNQTLIWDLYRSGIGATQPINGTGNATDSASTLYSWIYQLEQPYTFGEEYDFPQWGNFSYSSSPMGVQNFSFQAGFSADVRYGFVNKKVLDDLVDSEYRGSGTREPVFAFAHDVGNVTSAQVRYTIGSIQTPIIRYLHVGGLTPLLPWWAKCYGQDMYSLIAYHWNDFDTVSRLGADFEAQLKDDIAAYYQENPALIYSNQTPQAYYSIVALSARQIMGAYVYAIPPSSTCGSEALDGADESTPLMFQKEISSDGNVNTVDVLYPATPFFLWANPDMLKWTLEALFQNQEGGFYPNGYSMHDLGSNFPNATGHVEGNDEYMPVEESGNMILMSYAYYKFSGDSSWIKSHYDILKQWALYLIQFSLIPSAQLSTDDFAGTLQNQTNLAIKGIVGLQAMSAIARIAGEAADVANFSTTATQYYQNWTYFAIDPSENHTMLSYEWRSSWGLLYNVFFDKLLDLGIIDSSLYDMQSAWYATVSQVFGVPLDNRHHYTKSDWELWTAATCSPETRRLFVNGLAYWLNFTSTEYPFSDLYEVIADGSYPEVPDNIEFKARPVVGGHFSLLSLYRA